MTIRHNSKGIDPNPSFPTLPEGQLFEFKIMEATEMKSKKDLDMVKLRVEVINDPEWNGTSLFHYIVFIEKGNSGEGISVHFRKSCGLPYGGDDVIDEQDWIGKRFKATTKIEEYNGKRNSKIAAVESREEKVEEEIPF